MSTPATAAVTAATFVALFAGHQVGDHIVQSAADAAAKGAPAAAAGLHPWTGWRACLSHVATYALTQVLALMVAAAATPFSWYGMAAAVVVSASTHAVIDRRWIVRMLVRAKRCEVWRDGPYLIDQSLHVGILLPAAVLAALTVTPGALSAVAAGAVAIVGAGLAVERRLGVQR